MDYFKNECNVYFAKMKENAVIPNKKDEDAGYDFYACFDEDYILINSNETKLVPTGILWACSPSFYLQLEERSSTGTKGIKRSGGIIDSGYRGEIKIAITNANNKPIIFSNLSQEDFEEKYKDIELQKCIFYNTKKAIAQGIIHRVEKMNIKEITSEELLKIPSERKDKGFGSSNKPNL